ncbi:MAG: CDP-alcohol phosphatidyltransferase family protein [Dongiaceae bacterium]
MATLNDLKPRFQARLRPMTARLARAGVTANQVTVAALLLSILGGVLVAAAPAARWPLLLYPPLLFLRMALNAIDGMLAREHGQASRLGALLNELGDVIADAALLLPLALVPGMPGALLVLLAFVAALVEFAGLLGPAVGGSRRYDGPFGKSDRAFFLGSLALILAIFPRPGWGVDALLLAALALGLATVWRRLAAALREGGA